MHEGRVRAHFLQPCLGLPASAADDRFHRSGRSSSDAMQRLGSAMNEEGESY